MDTYNIKLTNGRQTQMLVSTINGDMDDAVLEQLAREDNLILDNESVESIEHWPTFDPTESKPSTFHLMGRLEVAKGITLEKDPAGKPIFKHPNGNTYRIIVALEETDQTGETRELDTADMDDLGFIEFGELDEHDIRIDEEG